jgi:hypothetical protein
MEERMEGRIEGGLENTSADSVENGMVGNPTEDRLTEQTREMKQQLLETKDELKQQLLTKKEELTSQAEEKADRWTTTLGDHLQRVSRAVRSASDALEDEGEGRLSAMTTSLAEQVDRVGGYLRDEKPKEMLEDLEGAARRNPGVFIGSVLVAGVLVGRFLKASAR